MISDNQSQFTQEKCSFRVTRIDSHYSLRITHKVQSSTALERVEDGGQASYRTFLAPPCMMFNNFVLPILVRRWGAYAAQRVKTDTAKT